MSKCTKCSGSGRIPNPDYPDNLRALDKRYEGGFLPYPLYESQIISLYGSMANIPEDYIKCSSCRGSGRIVGMAESPRGAYYGA